MKADVSAGHDLRVPRYTSYPTAPLKAYRDSVAAGELPIARGTAFRGEDRLRGEVIERLMCDLTADVDAIARRHGAPAGASPPKWKGWRP